GGSQDRAPQPLVAVVGIVALMLRCIDRVAEDGRVYSGQASLFDLVPLVDRDDIVVVDQLHAAKTDVFLLFLLPKIVTVTNVFLTSRQKNRAPACDTHENSSMC